MIYSGSLTKITSSAASSAVYRILVGPERAEFFVHSALLTRSSPVLRVMLESGLKEAATLGIEWDDVDVRTFVGFWQFLYTGSYDTPIIIAPKEPEKLSDAASSSTSKEPQDSALPEPTNEKEEWYRSKVLSKKKKKALKRRDAAADNGVYNGAHAYNSYRRGQEVEPPLKTQLWSDFQELSFADIPPEHSKPFGVEKYADLFTFHARIFILAEKYNVAPLMKLSLSRLHQSLVSFNIDTHGPSGVVDLLRFCYEEPKPADLRELVVLYAACKAKELWACEGFGDLMEESGEFSRAIMESIMQRID